MKIFVISNFLAHLEILDKVQHLIKKVIPDIIIFTGNIVLPGERRKEWELSQSTGKRARRNLDKIVKEIENNRNIVHQFLTTLSLTGVPSLFIPGKNDAPLYEISKELESFDTIIQNIHQAKTERDGFLFLGYGGGIFSTISDDISENYFVNIYTYNMLKYKLRRFKFSLLPKILVFHSCPTLPMFNNNNVQHEICGDLNSVFNYFSPDILITSGVSNPDIDFLENCWVINPGSLALGNACIFDTKKHDFKKLEL